VYPNEIEGISSPYLWAAAMNIANPYPKLNIVCIHEGKKKNACLRPTAQPFHLPHNKFKPIYGETSPINVFTK
jgi:hypothetical protein